MKNQYVILRREPLASCGVIAVLALMFSAASRVSADQVVTAAANYTHAKITGFEAGQIRLRTVDNATREIWIGDAQQIVVDSVSRFIDFNEAERIFAQGDGARALPRYEKTARIARDFWLDLVRTRMVMAADQAGDIREATLNWLRVLRGRWGGDALAATIIPRCSPSTPPAEVTKAVEQLITARNAARNPDIEALLMVAEFSYRSSAGDLHADVLADQVVSLYIPQGQRTARVYEIVSEAFHREMTGDDALERLPHLDRLIGEAPEAMVASLLLLKGDTLLRLAKSEDDAARAGWCYMRVVAHFGSDETAPRALLGAARVMSRLGKKDKAAALIKEARGHPLATDELRKQVDELSAAQP